MNDEPRPGARSGTHMDGAVRDAPPWESPSLSVTLLAPRELLLLSDVLRTLLDAGYEAFRARYDLLERVRTGAEGAVFKTLALHVNRAARDIEHAPSPAARAPMVRALKHLRECVDARAETLGVGETSPAASAQPGATPPTLEDAVRLVYESTVFRTPGATEIALWKSHFDKGLSFHEFLVAMTRSPEAEQARVSSHGLGAENDGRFVQLAHEHTQGRGPGAAEINHWLVKLERGEMSRVQVLSRLFVDGVAWEASLEKARPHDGLSCRIMGTERNLTAAEWARQAGELLPALAARPAVKKSPGEPRDGRYRRPFRVEGEPRVLVSAITSLYRGGRFIEQFMDNITSQEGFDEYCELVIVDADSPEGEAETIRRYMARHPNINYIRINHRIGIYDAWNVGARAARGAYLTNANLDDLRRGDSFMLQAGTLEHLPFVDVVYQDLFYTFDPDLAFETIAAFGHKTELPVVTFHNMVQFNSPHNAPMWRKSLHDELGYFDIHYKSAGDYEFWFRCLAAGKVFYKINDPHVAYYQNPQGLSTAPDSRGLREALEVHRRYCRKLMPDEVLVPSVDFLRQLRPRGGGTVPANRFRYTMAQDALRTVARTAKFAGGGA